MSSSIRYVRHQDVRQWDVQQQDQGNDQIDVVGGSAGSLRADDCDRLGRQLDATDAENILLSKESKRAKSGSLAAARIYVAVDGKHVEAARQALVHTAANIIQIDIDQPIVQSQARLERYLENTQQPRE